MAFNSDIKGYMTFGKSFSRGAAFPLEAYEIWTDYDALVAYAANTDPNKDPSYIGQKVAYVDTVNNKVTHYGIEIDGSLKELGATPIGDEKSIVVDETDYTISLKGVDALVFERDILGEDGEPTGEKEEVQFQPLMTKNGLVWVEPSKTTVEGLATLLEALTARVKALEDDRVTEQELADAIAGVEAKIEAVDFVDEDELAEAIKDFATDNEVAAAVKVETDRAEAAEKALGERIDAIDFVDETELANALAPYAKAEDVNTAINGVNEVVATKANQSDLEELANTVDAFLTGDGTEAALDSLKELIAYIESHDDTDIAGILESIQALEDKVDTGDKTVSAYVTAAIEALQIGDYAKAADLTELASRVATLEAKPFDSYATKAELEVHEQTAANTYATKAELEAHEGAAAAAYATKEELSAHEEAASAAYATKEELAAHEEAAEAAYATKDELAAHAEAAEAAYATKDELKATDDVAKDAQNRVGIVEGKIDEITSVGGEPNVIEKIKVNGVTLEVEKDAEGKSTKTVSISVPTSITGLDGYSDLDTRVTTNANGITTLNEQLANTNTNVTKNIADISAISTDITTNIKPAIVALEAADEVLVAGVAGNTADIKTLKETTIPAITAAIEAEAKARNDADQAILTKIGTVETGKTVVELINESKYDDAAVRKLISDEAARADAEEKRIVALVEAEAATARAAEKANADAIAEHAEEIAGINALLNTVDSEDTITSLKELAIWVEEHETEVLPVIEDQGKRLAAAEAILAGIGGEGETATVKKYVDDAIASIPGLAVATSTTLGGIKSAADVVNGETTTTAVNKVYVDATTGVAEVKAFSTDNLVQGSMTLVLNAGDVDVV